MRRVVAALSVPAVAGVVLLASAPAADASFCVSGARDRLAYRGTAFLGRQLTHSGPTFTFAVDERLRGDLPAVVEVRDEIPFSTASIDMWRLGPEQQVGVAIRRDPAGRWTGDLCSIVVRTPLPIDCVGQFAPDHSGFLQSPRTTKERLRTVRLRRAA